MRMHPLMCNTHILLGCKSLGVYLSPAMRLVAVTMLLWSEEWPNYSEGRYGMTYDELSDRTSLTPEQIEKTLHKMREVRLVEQRADGWMLTLDRFIGSVLAIWQHREPANQ